ncbi:MAG: hypothetical protein DI596_11860, partial [Azospira oryzae]
WLAIVPYWAAWPFETLVLPRFACARLPALAGPQRDSLAALLALLQIVSQAASGAEPPLVTVLGSVLGLGTAVCTAVVAVMGATCLFLLFVR